MPKLTPQFSLQRCPHCNISKPALVESAQFITKNHSGELERKWICYVCTTCGGVVTAFSYEFGEEVSDYFPKTRNVADNLPERPRNYLKQAIDSIHAPAGAVMLAASAVDSMLQLKGYKKGSLYVRIEKAVEDHLITKAMSTWAHQVRLDANNQRHADEEATLPTAKDAKRAISFTSALGQFLFVLPSLVQRGIDDASG